MKVAVTDYTFPDLSVEGSILAAEGHEVVGRRERPPAPELRRLVSDADAVIAQFAPIDADAIAAMGKARAIVRYGIGVDNVDLDAARAKGIPVCNVPDYCIDEVADHTLAFILAATRQVVPHASGIRAGGWGLAVPPGRMHALRDLTVGVVGFGRIGREVVARLRGFRPRILVHDPFAKAADIANAGAEPVGLPALLSGSDVVTLHVPSVPETRRLIRRETLDAMRPGALLINVARGDLIDADALVEALRDGKLAGAAFDVFSPEPIPEDHPIRSHPDVILAPHIASVSAPAVRALRETAAKIALLALRGDPLPNVVNGLGGRDA